MVPHRIAFVIALVATSARAQSEGDAVQRAERQLRELDAGDRLALPPDAAISERALLDWGGTLGFAGWSIDDEESKSHVLRQTDLRAWVRAELDGHHRVFARMQLQYDDWNTGEDFDGQGDDLREPVGERWWYEYDDARWRARVGKQFVEIGNGLVLSQTLIGARVEATFGGWTSGLLAADTPVNDFVDFDASRPSFDTNTKRRFLGAFVERHDNEVVNFAHLLVQQDRNDRDEALFQDGLGQLYPTEFEYDSTYVGFGARGPFGAVSSWRIELGFETGLALSSPVTAAGTPGPQTEERIYAWAFATGLSVPCNDLRRTRFDGDLIVASGDDDRLDGADTFGGNLSGTDDRAWNSFGYLDTGLALAPDPGNLATVRLGLETSPLVHDAQWERLRAVASLYFFTKLLTAAPLNVPTVNERFVGSELDVGFDWNFTSDVTFSFRYGAFMPGPAMPAGEDGTRQIWYGGVTYAF